MAATGEPYSVAARALDAAEAAAAEAARRTHRRGRCRRIRLAAGPSPSARAGRRRAIAAELPPPNRPPIRAGR